MKINRTKYIKRNVIYGVVLQLYRTIIPFLMRTALLYTLGVQYLGLSSLFSSVIQILNMAELGVGSAMVFSMYKPIAEDDTKKICALMNLYKKYYRIIGFVVLCLGLIIYPFIPHLISGETPDDINIYLLYGLNLLYTVLSYWLFAYKNSLLVAHARNDIVSKLTISSSTLMYILQITALFVIRNYYAYYIASIVSQIFLNISTSIVVGKIYPRYAAKGVLERKEVVDLNQRVKDLFTSKIGATIVNSADTIVISAFLGLTTLAMYQNYYFIMNSVVAFLTIFFTSCTAVIGNSLATTSMDRNFDDFKLLYFIICWIVGICSICFCNLYQPFMELWVGKNLMFEFPVVILLCLYFYLFEMMKMFSLYKDSAGAWHSDRFRPLLEGLLNLVLNLMTVRFWGIYGIIISTIVSMGCFSIPWLIKNLFQTVFHRSIKEFALYMIKIGSVTVVTFIVTYIVCEWISMSGIPLLIVRAFICVLLPNLLYFIFLRKDRNFKKMLCILKNMIHLKPVQ